MSISNPVASEQLLVELAALEPQVLEFLVMVGREVRAAEAKHAPLNSLHEAYAVIAEELDEFWDEVKKRDKLRDLPNTLKELVQVSAMGCRTALNCNLMKYAQSNTPPQTNSETNSQAEGGL